MIVKHKSKILSGDNMNNVENFIAHLDKYNTNLNVFIKLFNLWSRMNPDERGEVIDKKLINNL